MSMDIPRPYSANQTVVEDISETHVRYRPHFFCYASISLLAMKRWCLQMFNMHKKQELMTILLYRTTRNCRHNLQLSECDIQLP